MKLVGPAKGSGTTEAKKRESKLLKPGPALCTLLSQVTFIPGTEGDSKRSGKCQPWPSRGASRALPLMVLLKQKRPAAAAAKSLQSCPTLRDPMDGSPPGSHVPGILQARTLEWVAISFSSAWKWKVKGKSLSRVRLLATPWTAAYQAPPSMGFSRQQYWSGVPLLSPNKC